MLRMHGSIKILALSGLSFLLSGCGASIFSTRQTNPVVEGYVGIWGAKVGVLAPDASRRITTIRLKDGAPISRVYHTKDGNPVVLKESGWIEGEYCSEPPPDAMVATASRFYDALSAKLKIPDPKSGNAAAEGSGQSVLDQQIASAMSPLLRRSQGLQWARDNLSFLCNAHLNRAISNDQYLALINDVLKRSQGLVEKEIAALPVLEYKISGSPVGAPTLLPPPTVTAP